MGLLQAVFGNGGLTGTTTSTKRWPTFSPSFATNVTIANQAEQSVDTACTINNWRIRLSAAPGVGVTRTFTVYKNGSPTSLVVTISGTNQTNSDTSNSVTFAAGDLTYVEMATTGGTPATTLVQSVFDCNNDTYYTSLCCFGNGGTSSLAAPQYCGFIAGGEWSATAGNQDNVVAAPGTITGYRLELSAAPGAGRSIAFVIEKNGTAQDGTGGTPNTTLTISDTAVNGSTTFSLSVVANDQVRLKATGTGSPAISAKNGTGTFVATTARQYTLCATANDAPASGATEYNTPFGDGVAWDTTEANTENIGPESTVGVRAMYVATAAPGSGKSYSFTLRKNSTGTGQSITIADLATNGGPDTSSIVQIGSADRVSIESVPSGAPAVTRAKIAFLAESMVIQTVATAKAAYTSASSGATTASFDSTGATLIEITAVVYSGGSTPGTISDSKGNSYTGLTAKSDGTSYVRKYYNNAPVTGSGHTVSLAGNTLYGAVVVRAYSAPALVFHSEASANGSGTSLSTGSVTPTLVPALVTSGLGWNHTVTGLAATSPMILIDSQAYTASQCLGCAASDERQTTATARNPEWTWTNSGPAAGVSAAYMLDDPSIVEVRLTSQRVEMITQNSTAEIRLTSQRVEVMGQISTAEIRLTSQRVEVLQSTVEMESTFTPGCWMGSPGDIWVE